MGKMSQGVRNGPCCVYQFSCTYLTAPGAKYLSTLLSVWGVACLSLFMNCLDSCARAVEGPTGSTERQRPKRNTPRVRRAQRMLSLGQRGWSNISPRNVVSCACFVENMLETFQIYKKTSAPTFVFCPGCFLEVEKVTAVLTSHVGEPKNNGICNWVSWVVAKSVLKKNGLISF